MAFDSPPAIVQEAPAQSPLMSEMIKRAAEQYPLEDANTSSTQLLDTKKPSAKWPMLAALLGGAGDVWSTQRNLAMGGHEQNPMLPKGRLANGLVLGGEYVGAALLSKLLNDTGHDKLAKLVGYGNGINGGLMTLHNVGAFKWPGEK